MFNAGKTRYCFVVVESYSRQLVSDSH